MGLETKFLRLSKQVELGDEIEGWQVCWLAADGVSIESCL